ncbi:SCO-spondin-like isoform X2 [Amphibalanus amphitrite]|uniref:SCO-spondin-like isoform X2 n=1 Tax=Amphibalanus amphitrite TaxID=1232801 RepID=UPI001C928A7B|nr:SCO-spondin-like isoform X2 [Amphibalanus amphitrite]
MEGRRCVSRPIFGRALVAAAGLLMAAVTAAGSPAYQTSLKPTETLPCRHGLAFIDQCQNRCTCTVGGQYQCTEKGCLNGTPGEPMACEVDGEIRVTAGWRLFCKRGIVRAESTDLNSQCTPGTSWQEACNTCTCVATGQITCTNEDCQSGDQGPFHCQGKTDCQHGKPILGGGGGDVPDIPVKRYCDGPCPADCGEELDAAAQCVRCRCLPDLEFGDVVVAVDEPCPSGLQQGPTLFATKICRGQGCTPGSGPWNALGGGCSLCICTQDGEPACTPCQRDPTPLTLTCDGGLPECPQDCGTKYNKIKDCFDCPCGVGEPGDTHVAFEEPCPPGTDFRESGAFFKACGPIDTLPKGDTKICDSLECPADCGTVRVSTQENCAYCQCGPELAPGDTAVPIYQQCPPDTLPGPTQLTTKVCRAPTREECVPNTTYNIKCDICICQDNGVPTCTLRDCTLPEYGDVQVCDSQLRGCPADCGTAGSDSYCQYCQCGPRLEEGDITVAIDEPCPPGFTTKEHQFATKTCSPVPGGGREGRQYCSGPCPADCGEVLDAASGCYRCQCGPQLQFGDVQVAIDAPCPPGLAEGPSQFATKVCLGQGCQPGSEWSVQHDGCSRCVCTNDGEPACTPCKREPSASTLTCDGGLPECPQDCGRTYNAGRDCFECKCGVGEPGDTHVGFEEPCPPGTDFRESGAFFKACGPIDTLPKGDVKVCGGKPCPADCGTVRFSSRENCVYCQCGLELAPGEEEVPVDEPCQPGLVEGPRHLATKVCRAPNREECVPYDTYNIGCDICLCQEDGVPACTQRNCSLPQYGDVQVCDSQLRGCPADCGTAGSDSYCQYCQCGPRLEEGDITVAIDEPCPPGFTTKEHQFATKTCSPVPDGGREGRQYCSGPCPADCGEVLDAASGCYRCQCGPQLQFGDVQVAIDAPCPPGLAEGPSQFATKVCLGQGCQPGSEWSVHHDGCSRCVCTDSGEPACTPCKREPSTFTPTCDGSGQIGCPQDCGKTYNAGRDCFECKCGVGEPGDTHVAFEEPCPPGTDFRESGAFFKACGPIDTLPKGDTKICDSLECPADCGTVRVSTQENCAYCQCGPELAPGDTAVPIYQQCPPDTLPGPTQLTTKVCRAPTREECIPGSEYNVGCDLCLCQEDGIPACTMRECSQSGSPEDGDSSQGGDNSSSEEDEDGEGQGYGKDESSSDENSSEERY